MVLVALAGSAEFFGWIYLRHVVELDWRPAWQGPTLEDRRIGPWRVAHAAWGNWRIANTEARHESACFSVALRSNSVGAHDRERTLEGDQRTIVLGDSFAEGWGVEDAQRVSNLLEAQLGREFLNFAASSHGPLQYQLVYQQLASRYAHDHVLILLLPDNDFTDNDYAVWRAKTRSGARARPYYERTGDGTYRAIYPVSAADENARTARAANPVVTFGDAIRRNSWALRTLQHVGELWDSRRAYAGYFDVTDAQLDAVSWSLGEIKRTAGHRRVTVALIPRPSDMARTAREGPGNLPARLTARVGPHDISVIDLLPALRAAADPAALYLRCDGHWTVAGNAAAAAALRASDHFR